MRFLLGLIIFLMVIAYFLSLFKSDSLVQIYCSNESQRLTRKEVQEGFKLRNHDNEEENFEVCVEDNQDLSVLHILVKYVQLPTLTVDGQYQ